MSAVRSAGGLTVAQSQKTCVVFGMPKAAIERGYVMRVADLHDLPNLLQAQCVADQNRADDEVHGKAIGAGSN